MGPWGPHGSHTHMVCGGGAESELGGLPLPGGKGDGLGRAPQGAAAQGGPHMAGGGWGGGGLLPPTRVGVGEETLPPFLVGKGRFGGRSPTPPPNPSWEKGGTPPSLPWSAGPKGEGFGPFPKHLHPLASFISNHNPLGLK